MRSRTRIGWCQVRTHRRGCVQVADEGVVSNRDRTNLRTSVSDAAQVAVAGGAGIDCVLSPIQPENLDSSLRDYREILFTLIPQDRMDESIPKRGGADFGNGSREVTLPQTLSNGRHAIDLNCALRWVTLRIRLLAYPLDQVGDCIRNKISQFGHLRTFRGADRTLRCR